MASKKSKGNSPGTKKDSKHGGKNGKKGEGLSGSSFFTWFMVIALLGVWTSVAVVWFDLVDYEDILARAKDFKYNFSEVLQGKLGVYDADGDGDFDVEDAKILLGLKESSGAVHPTPASDEDVQPVVRPPVESEPEIVETEEEEIIQATHEALQSEQDEDDDYDYQGDEPEAEDDIPVESELDLEPEEILYEQDMQAETEPDVEDSYTEEVQEEPKPEPEAVEVEEETEPEHHIEEEPETEAIEVEEEILYEDQAAEEPEPETKVEEEEETVTEDETEEEPEPETKVEEEEETVTEDETEGRYEEEHQVTEEQHTETEKEPEVISEPEEVQNVEEEVQEAVYEEPGHLETEDYFEDQIQQDYHYQEEEIQEAVPVDESEDEAAVPLPESHYEYTDKEEEPEVIEEAPALEEEAEVLEEPPADEETEEEVPLEDKETVLVEKQQEVPAEVTETEEPSEAHNLKDEAPHVETGSTYTEEKKQEETAVKKKKPKLLNKFDKTIKAELDAAEKLRKKGKTEAAVKAFEGLVTAYPDSPRARYGKAQCEDDLAEKLRSNEMLQKAISTYGELADLPNVPSDLLKLSLKRRAERQQFLGRMRGSLLTLQKLVQLFPDDLSLKNDLGVGYLLMGDNAEAKKIYTEVLATAPDNGFAQVHYGFILKAENKIAESIPYLQRGLESGEPGTDDGRFYFHLGDALQRVGSSEAYKWYEIGHQRGHFASVWQRSLYNVDGLKAQPWWTAKETGYTELVKALEKNWKVIRDDGLAVMNTEKGLFLPEDENLRETGDWGQFTLWQQGRKNENACKKVSRTCTIMERFPESTGCKRGQVKYSIMQPGTHVWPHTGPTNCRIRMHLGLVIPKVGCRIRCGNDTRTWEEGKVLIFDDSFEHEVWQEASSFRLIFIVDVWHPDLTFHQRRTLSPI